MTKLNLSRRNFLAGATAFVAGFRPQDVMAMSVPRGAFWLHFSNLDHNANPKLERARKNNTRIADISDWRVKNNAAFPLHPGLITSAVHAYNLRSVPSSIKAYHQPGGAALNPYMLPSQNPASLRGYGSAPLLEGQKAQATWVFQTAGDVATIELPIDMLIRNKSIQEGTYFIVCHTAGEKRVIPANNNAAHVTSSMMHWHLRSGGSRRATLARTFA